MTYQLLLTHVLRHQLQRQYCKPRTDIGLLWSFFHQDYAESFVMRAAISDEPLLKFKQ